MQCLVFCWFCTLDCALLWGAVIAQVQLKGSVSSQYLTALLMAAPLSKGTEGIEIIITDELVSWQKL